MVQLDVDSEVNHVVGPLNPKPVDHREPVFVGGVPGKSYFKRTSFQIKKKAVVLRTKPCLFAIHLTLKIFIYSVFSQEKVC